MEITSEILDQKRWWVALRLIMLRECPADSGFGVPSDEYMAWYRAYVATDKLDPAPWIVLDCNLQIRSVY
jgi:hypothetical protein